MKTLRKLFARLRPAPVIRYRVHFRTRFDITWDTPLSIEEAWPHLPKRGETFHGHKVEDITCFRLN